MALNDRDVTLRPGASNDQWPGTMNPTSSGVGGDHMAANYVDDPTNPEGGAGAGSEFHGDRDAAKAMKGMAGVVESRPGIIESTEIDPLSETSNKDDGWANATQNPGANASDNVSSTASDILASASNVAAAAAKSAYGSATGNEQLAKEGRDALFGSNNN
ncbi:hypothetical protein SISSUDRAFT_1057183 [Sistotremastrum suecicum HHB10207 ss-3]|uniref:SMP domain-containing protein n=1 Tax=Sistotremastrum suecicum HHB10207 ss-3 TaxID=1314776 RepID=A0A166IYC0_9AGAM|nr:hypothetical protein SISSUDRAFT_1057183 [Sistotremastrum suecicum HHB10207 ss-3]